MANRSLDWTATPLVKLYDSRAGDRNHGESYCFVNKDVGPVQKLLNLKSAGRTCH
jgi:hypothetical protein